MNRHLLILLLIFAAFQSALPAQDKIPLSPGVYEDWKRLMNPVISPDGRYITYEINPQKGDGFLVIRDLQDNTNDTIPRAYDVKFSFDSKILAGKVKPVYDSIQREKQEGRDVSKDSLFIRYLANGRTDWFASVRSYCMSENGNNIVVFQHEFTADEKDESGKKSKNNGKKKSKYEEIREKFKASDLVIYDINKQETRLFENVVSYTLSDNGNLVGFHQLSPDSTVFSVVYAHTAKDNILDICYEGRGMAGNLTSDKQGKKLAFLFMKDTAMITGAELHYWEIGKERSVVVLDSSINDKGQEMLVNKFGKLYFSGDSKRLFYGSSPARDIPEEDSLPKDERVSLDVWSWEDQLLQPNQKKLLERELKRTYLAYYDLERNRPVQIADREMEKVITMNEDTGNVMIGIADRHYGKLISWEGLSYKDIYFINPVNGNKRLLVKKISSSMKFSPGGNYFVYYSREDSCWYSIQPETGRKINITVNLTVNFYNERNDIPMLPGSYGLAGFTRGDEYVLIYDRYDIWKIDPSGEELPEMLTNGLGRKNKTRLRYVRLDRDEKFIDLDEVLYFSAFNEENMKDGYYNHHDGKLSELVLSAHEYTGLIKAEDSDVFAFRRGNFREYDDLYISGRKLENAERISVANPQQKNFLWGNVELVEWRSFNGELLKGLLYTPENLDKNKKYPLLVYFYERSSENLFGHRIPSPSRSIINPSYCVSNGYIVFVPDIVYRTGYPGQSAYDAVVSGTQAMTERYSFIDKDRMGLQGQSWGGYQVAWLITRTNMYKAAMAGAPVSNMTSAYGGIRWGTGKSRMFQYEQTQSRIGRKLWDGLDLYLENSPLFDVPRIETPLLIMHNDNDGAVPWYQGIELFVALRRLSKPVWMLSYNDEAHNLRRWPNRIDLDIRMMQFFDHYLKGEKMPRWMKEGVPATEKNEVTGFELLEQ